MEFVPDWNTKKFSGAMNIPFSDTFAMRIAAQKESSDGWVYYAYLNEVAPATESEAIRATMLWELDNMEVNLKLSSLNTEKKGSEMGIYKYQLAAPFPALANATPPYTGAVINWRITNAFFPNQISGVPGVTYTDNTTYQNPTGGTVDSNNAILKISSMWNDVLGDLVDDLPYPKWYVKRDPKEMVGIAIYKGDIQSQATPAKKFETKNNIDWYFMDLSDTKDESTTNMLNQSPGTSYAAFLKTSDKVELNQSL